MKTARCVWITISFLLGSTTLHAQGGCIDSPEAPTAVLFLVGGGSVALEMLMRRGRRKPQAHAAKRSQTAPNLRNH